MTFDELIKDCNNKNTDSDLKIVKCKHCGIHSYWGGYKDDPTMWSCEECGDIFCDKCSKVDNENDGRVLCKGCKNVSKNKQAMTLKEAKADFRRFQMSTLFMDIESMIDCCGITFEEWVEQNSIIIKN